MHYFCFFFAFGKSKNEVSLVNKPKITKTLSIENKTIFKNCMEI